MTAPILDLDLPPEHPLRQILDFIAAHPEVRQPVLRALLTEDFLSLPVQVQQLAERVDGVAGQVDELREDVASFKDETREQFRVVNARIDETNQSMQEQFQQVNTRIDGVNARIDGVNTRIDGVNTRIDETNQSMQEQFQQVNTRIDGVNTRIGDSAESVVRRMEGSLGRFRGETYEKRCAEKLDELLVDHFAYAQPLDREPINRQLAQVRQNGTISRQEYLDGRSVDIIAQDTFADDGERRWAVVEVSITFNRNDLENAARRAAIIARVFGVQTQAFVVTNSPWPDDVNTIAEQMGVTIVRNHDPAYEAQPL